MKQIQHGTRCGQVTADMKLCTCRNGRDAFTTGAGGLQRALPVLSHQIQSE